MYLSKNFATEVCAGYFETENNFYNGKVEIYAIPLSTNVKGIVPFKYGEFFLGAGFVGYTVHAKLDVGPDSESDYDYIFGGQFLGGFNFDINDTFFFGIEGKYMITQDVKFEGDLSDVREFNLNGFIATGVLGFRF